MTDTSTWPWWWSHDEERYSGPCGSRAEAILEAHCDHPERGYVYIMQATHDEPRTDIFDVDWLQEQFDDANEDVQDLDGDHLSSQIPVAEWKSLAESCGHRLRVMIRKNGVRVWGFSGMSAVETVDLTLPELAAVPSDARGILAELAHAWSDEFDPSEGYVDDLVKDLKKSIKRDRASPAVAA